MSKLNAHHHILMYTKDVQSQRFMYSIDAHSDSLMNCTDAHSHSLMYYTHVHSEGLHLMHSTYAHIHFQ